MTGNDGGKPLEIERKFLIRMPERSWLEEHSLRSIRIEQTYLHISEPGESRRVRRSVSQGQETLTYTRKLRLTDRTRIEEERTVTPEEYDTLLRQADPARRPVRKTRWCVPYAGHMLEIDVFPFWQRQAYCEAELKSETEPLELPAEITVLREVTADPRYTNSALALAIPPEMADGT